MIIITKHILIRLNILLENIKGLWNLEAMTEITVEDIELQSKWSRITHLDSLLLRNDSRPSGSEVLNISNSSFTNKTLLYVMKYDSEETIGKDNDDQNGHMIRMLRQEPMSDVRPFHVKPKSKWSMFDEIDKISVKTPSIPFLKCMMITTTIFLVLKWFVLRKWLSKVYGVKSITKYMLLFLIIHSLVYLSNVYL
ncbi:uncharacterized protein LOC117123432 [Anneissia japonica]|uniref:uncharacterized protein LOC117123432 n=1 Tax=Anneissia japonica TaxID=1529436 RepID=UPI0014259568|nr:uncharacterized protein LOC117123432 [Anneissia japonica]